MFTTASPWYHFVSDGESSLLSPGRIFVQCVHLFLFFVTGIKIPPPKEIYGRFYFSVS